jgi:hypothetical protein
MPCNEKNAADDAFITIRSIALMAVQVPKADRPRYYAEFERSMKQELLDSGLSDSHAADWVRAAMRGVEALVQEIEISGGGKGGNA